MPWRASPVTLPLFRALRSILLIALLLPAKGQFPGPLKTYLDSVVKLSPWDRKRLLEGLPVTKILDGGPDSEVVVFGAVWINAPRQLYVKSLNDIENWERGGAIKTTKRIGKPPKPADFALLVLPEKDVTSLKSCRPGRCPVKLSREEIEKFRTEIDWTKPTAKTAAQDLFRRLLFRYVADYVERGNSRLAVYSDKERPMAVETELRALVDRLPSLMSAAPELHRCLLNYPQAALPGSTDFLYWQETQFGLKPTIRVSHVIVRESAEETVVASKMIYSSHYFWTALELRVLMADRSRGSGFWFVTVNSSRSDGLDGLRGRIMRILVNREVQKGTLGALNAIRTKLERQVR